MVNTAQQAGGSIGTAVFSSLAATQSRTIPMPDVETTRAKQQRGTGRIAVEAVLRGPGVLVADLPGVVVRGGRLPATNE